MVAFFFNLNKGTVKNDTRTCEGTLMRSVSLPKNPTVDGIVDLCE